MKRSVKMLAILFAIVCAIVACEGKKEIEVITNEVTEITANSAKCGGNVTDDGGRDVTLRGVCWSTSPNPTINDNYTVDGSGEGEFISNMTGLTPNTTYYVRAYATNRAGTSYGEQMSFTTERYPIGGYDYVDLGLPSGLKWATCNIGASSPEEYGNYYAWGETEPKSTYTEYNSITYGEQMGDISGDPEYDAATANWGSTWRMPTEEECEELVDECTWQWTTQNGVNGYKVIGPNGNHIFLPAAGYRDGSSLSIAGESGSYWSSTPDSDDDYAFNLYFDSSNYGVYYYTNRYYGRSVRPVSE